MSDNRKTSRGLLVGFILACVAFLGYQYFMAAESEATLEHEKVVRESETQISGKLNRERKLRAIDAYISFVEHAPADNPTEYAKNALTRMGRAFDDLSEVTALEADDVLDFNKAVNNFDTQASAEDLKDLLTQANTLFDDIDLDVNKEVDRDMYKLEQDINSIEDNVSLADQSDVVNDYFNDTRQMMSDLKVLI